MEVTCNGNNQSYFTKASYKSFQIQILITAIKKEILKSNNRKEDFYIYHKEVDQKTKMRERLNQLSFLWRERKISKTGYNIYKIYNHQRLRSKN